MPAITEFQAELLSRLMKFNQLLLGTLQPSAVLAELSSTITLRNAAEKLESIHA